MPLSLDLGQSVPPLNVWSQEQRSLLDIMPSDAFFSIKGIVVPPVFVKAEGLNAAGSIKLRTAARIIADMETSGTLRPNGTIIESSSGNLGVALAMIAARKGYRFICVTDANAAPASIQIMRAVGATVVVVAERDKNGGYLASRIRLIKEMCAKDTSIVWTNQYANESNWKAHYASTAADIYHGFGEIDWLVIGAGTTGTLMGCARYFREHSPRTKLVAVDTEGSITFGGLPGRRYIPGLGTSLPPAIAEPDLVDEIIYISEVETVKMCRQLAGGGVLVGGSTGTVLAGIASLRGRIDATHTVVTISPDLGSKYLDTIYNDEWVRKYFPTILLADDKTPEVQSW